MFGSFFFETALKILITSRRYTEDWKGTRDLLMISSIGIRVEIFLVLFGCQLLIQLSNTLGKILLNSSLGILIPAGNAQSRETSQLQYFPLRFQLLTSPSVTL